MFSFFLAELHFGSCAGQEAFFLEFCLYFFDGLHQVVLSVCHFGDGGGHRLPYGLHAESQCSSLVGKEEEAFALVLPVPATPDEFLFFNFLQ